MGNKIDIIESKVKVRHNCVLLQDILSGFKSFLKIGQYLLSLTLAPDMDFLGTPFFFIQILFLKKSSQYVSQVLPLIKFHMRYTSPAPLTQTPETQPPPTPSQSQTRNLVKSSISLAVVSSFAFILFYFFLLCFQISSPMFLFAASLFPFCCFSELILR